MLRKQKQYPTAPLHASIVDALEGPAVYFGWKITGNQLDKLMTKLKIEGTITCPNCEGASIPDADFPCDDCDGEGVIQMESINDWRGYEELEEAIAEKMPRAFSVHLFLDKGYENADINQIVVSIGEVGLNIDKIGELRQRWESAIEDGKKLIGTKKEPTLILAGHIVQATYE